MPNNSDSNQSPLILRQSVVCFSLRLLLLQLIFTSLYLLVILPINIIDFSPQIKLMSLSGISFLLIIFFTVNMILTTQVVISWLGEYYVLMPDSIIFRKGIFMRKEKLYTLQHIETITYSQNFLERLLNFGTILLHDPLLKQNIHIDSIKNPEKYVRILEKQLSERPKTPTGVLFSQKGVI